MLNRLGIIGAGQVARHHADAAAAMGAEIVTACTGNENSANWTRFRHHAPTASRAADGAEILLDPDVEAVIACMNWDVMPEWLERLLVTEKPVLLEKPIGLELYATLNTVRGALNAGSLKMVGYNRRFYKTVILLRERIRGGGLKAVDVVISEPIESHRMRHGEVILPHLLVFSSAHSLDLMLHLLGPLEPVAVSAHTGVGSAAPFKSYNGLLRTVEGIPVSLALNADDPTPAGIRCRFDDGSTWHLTPLEVLTIYKGMEVAPARAECSVRRYTPKMIDRHVVDMSVKPGFREQMAAFLAGKPGVAASVTDAIKVLELINILDMTTANWGGSNDNTKATVSLN